MTRRDVVKGVEAARGGPVEPAPEEGHELRARDIIVGSEASAVDAGGDALLERPCDGVAVILAAFHVGEGGLRLRRGRAGQTPEEGHDLGAGAHAVGVEGRRRDAGGDALIIGPEYRVGEVDVAALRVNVAEGIFRAAHRTHAADEAMSELAHVAALEFLRAAFAGVDGVALL